MEEVGGGNREGRREKNRNKAGEREEETTRKKEARLCVCRGRIPDQTKGARSPCSSSAYHRAFHRAQYPCKALHAAGAVRDGVQREAADTGESSLRGCTRGDVAGGGVRVVSAITAPRPSTPPVGSDDPHVHGLPVGASHTLCWSSFWENLDAETWRRMGADTETNARCDLLFVLTAGRTFCTLYRARAGDEENSKWTIANTNSEEVCCADPRLATTLLAYRELDRTDPLTCNNTSWHIGSRTAPTPVARAVSPDLVDSDSTSSKIGCSVPTPVACAVSPNLVDSNNTLWKIVGSVPTPVARAVSPDLVDSDNTSWKILCNPVVQARAENVDSDNKSWEIHDTCEEVDVANISWTTRSTKATPTGPSATTAVSSSCWSCCPRLSGAPAPSVAAFRSDSVPSLLTGSTTL
ncbi:hypothetical protein B0H14DRAFT_2608395 [Mycena olivaceomarginata]|nr:hypothetical protein B0H14DRAFT_2608395 [Mycena olivaceomarginata]